MIEAARLIREPELPQEVGDLFPSRRDRDLAPGQVLFRQGDPAGLVFLIRFGLLRMLRHSPGGEPIILHTGRAGETFAEGALLAPAYHCEAQAAGPARVGCCPVPELRRAIEASPSFALAWIERVTSQLQAARSAIELRDLRPEGKRVLRHLRLRADETGEVRFEGRLRDAAAGLGLSHEAYYRALATLARSGAIARAPGRIRLLAPHHLHGEDQP